MIRIGVLSDTHLSRPTDLFVDQVAACFSDADVIFHAGDLTDLSILSVFKGKEVHAVHGNMCVHDAYKSLPRKKIVEIRGFRFGITHGAGYFMNIEEHLWDAFDLVDCIVYGHTHRPVCHKKGAVLFVNPGSFVTKSRYGTPGTYATIDVGDKLIGKIHEVRVGR